MSDIDPSTLQHWASLVDDNPVWAKVLEKLEDSAIDTLNRLVRAEPGSATQTRLVGELTGLLHVIDAPTLIRGRAERDAEKRRQVTAERRSTRRG